MNVVVSQFLMPLNKPTISEQFEHMNRPSVWETHLEMKAAATLLQVPVYFCMQITQSDLSIEVFSGQFLANPSYKYMNIIKHNYSIQ